MISVRGVVVCVEYDDYLALTLPRNARHLTDILVVTTPGDAATRAVVSAVPSARVFTTDAFHRNGAAFNKGAALEEAFDAFGREGWLLIWDADILLPDVVDWGTPNPGWLHGARRRLCPSHTAPADWRGLSLSVESGWPGYFQLFHADGPRAAVRPWYGVTSPHAGYGDAHFQSHWPDTEKGHVPFEVLHLGPRDTNWFGRVSPRADGTAPPAAPARLAAMDGLLAAHGWTRQR